jgi:hypothetical protein
MNVLNIKIYMQCKLRLIVNLLINFNNKDNKLSLELKHNLKDAVKVKELQYKLTDNQDPNNVCVEVIRDVSHLTPELSRLYHKIMNF